MLEYVEGDTRAARAERGALPVRKTLDVCGQIAEAIEITRKACAAAANP